MTLPLLLNAYPRQGRRRISTRADAVGYPLPVLRTSCPIVPDPSERLTYTPKPTHHPAAASGPEGRKTVAHGVSRGWMSIVVPQPQRGDRTRSHGTGQWALKAGDSIHSLVTSSATTGNWKLGTGKSVCRPRALTRRNPSPLTSSFPAG
jgi:hypothetical protein